MQSFVYVACLLASLAAANPVEVERRQFAGPLGIGGGYGGVGGAAAASSQHYEQSSASSSVQAGGGGFGGAVVDGVGGFGGIGGVGGAYGGIGGGFGGVGGGFGGVGIGGGYGGVGGGMSSFSQSSSSSYSYSNVVNSFQGIGSEIGAIRAMMVGGGFSQAIAVQRMTRLASMWQLALSQSAGCGCFGQGNFIGAAGGVFNQFYSLMTSMQSMFGGGFGSILAPFGGLGRSFQSFSQSFSSAGYSMSSIVPAGLPSILGNVIPGLPHMVGFK